MVSTTSFARFSSSVVACISAFLFIRVDAFVPISKRASTHHHNSHEFSLLQNGEGLSQHMFNIQSRSALFDRYSRDDDDDNDDDDDDDDDDDPPDVDVKDFHPPKKTASYGLNRGKSAPSQRKAMGTSAGASTRVHVCTNCGSEFVKWMGRCPTCKEWNTLQEFAVARGPPDAGRPDFSSGRGKAGKPSSSSWLNGILADSTGGGSPSSGYMVPPVRMTDIIAEYGGGGGKGTKRNRIIIPDDKEMNTVLGGGLMKGSLTLLGGDPGVGKSTLLLQTAASIATLATPVVGIGMGGGSDGSFESEQDMIGPVWYISGEETPEQIASRAARLGIASPELFLLGETQVNILCEQVVNLLQPTNPFQDDAIDDSADETTKALLRPKLPSMMVVDSIQTMVCDAGGSSAAGGVTQVRECVALLLRLAKSVGIPIFLVGHVTKSGDVAGPRTVEHMVDAVLYLEGTTAGGADSNNLRILRASKNRFGSSTEVGVYEMTSGKLMPVSDPSSFLLANRIETKDVEGCAVALIVEGTLRVLTVEMQALVTSFSASEKSPRRTVNGIGYSRLQLLLGVLQKHVRLYFGRQDVYVNVVGALQLNKGESGAHASDLAIIVALASSLKSIPVRGDTAFCGEVGLLGELRRIPNLEQRVQEARRMGFSRVITPPDPNNSFKHNKRNYGKQKGNTMSTRMVDGIEWVTCENVRDAINAGLVTPIPTQQRSKRSAGKGSSSKFSDSLEQLNLDAEPILDDDDYDDDADKFGSFA